MSDQSSQQPPTPPPKKPVAQGAKANPRNFRPGAKQQQGAAPAAGAAPAGAAASNPQDTSGLGAVVVRNEFYRDGYRTALRIALIEAVIIFGLIITLFYVVHIHQPEHRYFATTEDGRLVPMVAMNQANLSKPALMSWVAQAVTEVMTFGFQDYRRRLQESSRHFTRTGWGSFTTALENSGILESVEANRQLVTAIPAGAPILQAEGIDQNGRYFWQVQLPINVRFQSGARSVSNRMTVQLVIVRVPRLESQYGIGIEQWVSVGG
mgnify:CR=1 FL=1